MKFPSFETDRLTIDQIEPKDSKSIFELFSNPEVVKYYDLNEFKKETEASKLIELFRNRYKNSLGIRWAIRFKNKNKISNRLIGTCGYNSWNKISNSTVIGYDLNRKYWGKGIITEALGKIIEAGFAGELSLKTINRIQADTVAGNVASEAVLKKLGFVEEGILRESGYWKGSYYDLKCFGLVKSEF